VISLVIWMTAITLSIVLTILSAAGGDPLLHLAVTGAISVAIAVVGMQTRRRLEAEGAVVRSSRPRRGPLPSSGSGAGSRC
jgi:hypothetical protein